MKIRVSVAVGTGTSAANHKGSPFAFYHSSSGHGGLTPVVALLSVEHPVNKRVNR